MQQPRGLIGSAQRQAHQLVTALDFTDADPALPGLEQAIGEVPIPWPRQSLRLGSGLRSAFGISGKLPVLAPQAARLDPGQDQLVLLHRGGEHTAAVVVHAAAQIDGGRGELLSVLLRNHRRLSKSCGAAALLGALFQPDQPDQRCIGARPGPVPSGPANGQRHVARITEVGSHGG